MVTLDDEFPGKKGGAVVGDEVRRRDTGGGPSGRDEVDAHEKAESTEDETEQKD